MTPTDLRQRLRFLALAIGIALLAEAVSIGHALWFLFSPQSGLFDSLVRSKPQVMPLLISTSLGLALKLEPALQACAFAIFLAAAMSFVAAPYRSRLPLAILLIILAYYAQANLFIFESGDRYLQALLVCLVLMPRQLWSWNYEFPIRNIDVTEFVLRGARLLWASIYFFSGLWKWLGGKYLDGSIPSWIAHSVGSSAPAFLPRLMSWNPSLFGGLTIAFEILVPFGLFGSRRVRLCTLTVLAIFHVMVGILFGIWIFGVIMTAVGFGLFYLGPCQSEASAVSSEKLLTPN